MNEFVILESPYRGNKIPILSYIPIIKNIMQFFIRLRNIHYARKCLLDSLNRGEIPFISHLLYTQVLDDNDEKQRSIGLNKNFKWYEKTNFIVFYTDLGWSEGMNRAFLEAEKLDKKIVCRQICLKNHTQKLKIFRKK